MSKNIIIQEGGTGRQFTASKLKTALVGGGNCNWVPEDEVGLGTKHITENGTYNATDDSLYGYSQVAVNITGMSKIITGIDDEGEPTIVTVDTDGNISEIILGDYFIVSYDKDGYVAKIEDNNGNRCLLVYDGETLTGFDDAGNNHYTIIMDDDKITEVINPNAQDCELKDRDGDGLIDIISNGEVYRVTIDDEEGIKIIDVNDQDVTDDFDGTSITGTDVDEEPWKVDIDKDSSSGKTSQTTNSLVPGTTPGASITGIDTDGDKVTATLNDDLGIEITKLPSSIAVTTMPSKTTYTAGEMIDISGIVVKGYLNSGEPWTDSDHPDGVIPVSELSFEPQIAVATESHAKEWGGTTIEYVNLRGIHRENFYYLYSYYEYLTDGYVIAIPSIDGGGGIAYIFQEEQEIQYWSYYADGSGHTDVQTANLRPITLADGSKTVYMSGAEGGASYYTPEPPLNDVSAQPDFSLIAQVLFGEGSQEVGGTIVTIRWKHPMDSVELETSFHINVNDEGGGGGGGGGDSPVPAGVTVQDLNIAIYNATNAGLDYIEIDGQQYSIAEAQAMIDYLISH